MAESEFDENLLKHDQSWGGDHDSGFGVYENISYNGVRIFEHEDIGSSGVEQEDAGIEWLEGKRKFKCTNPEYDASKIYDVMELYAAKKDSN